MVINPVVIYWAVRAGPRRARPRWGRGMKKALVMLIAGAVLSGVAAYVASARVQAAEVTFEG